MGFVELERRFRRLADAELEDAERFTYWDQQGLGPGIGWPELLQHERVVSPVPFLPPCAVNCGT